MSIFKKMFGGKSEEQDYLDKLERKETRERSNMPSVKLEKAEERRYLAELKNKERSEIAELNKERFRETGSKAFGGLVKIGEGAVATGRYVGSAVGSTEAGKYAGARIQGALEFVPKGFEKLRLDYESGKISKKAYEDAYRKAGEQSAEKRGGGEEQRKYTEKIGKKTLKAKREEANRDIEISAKKAFHVEKARTSGRIAARQERKTQAQERIAFAQTQQPQFGVPPQRQRRQWVRPNFSPSPLRQPNEYELDPMNLYSMRMTQTQQQTQTPKYNPAQMHALLGYFPNRPQQSQPQAKVQPQPRPQQAPIRADTSNFANSMLSLNIPRQSQVQPLKTNGKRNGKKNGNVKRKPRYNMFTGTWE